MFFRTSIYLSARSPKSKLVLKRILPALALLFATLSATAQAHHEFGISAGVSNYRGDLQQEWFAKKNYHPVGGVFYKYFFNPHLGFRLGANYTQLAAADSLSDVPVYKARNLSFKTNLFEFNAGLELNLLPITIDRFKVSPYIFGGVAVFYHNPFAYDTTGDRVYLRPLSTEGQGLSQYPDRKEYSLVNVAFPIGGGLKFFVGNTLMITTEMGFRYCATDYMDDVSKSYVSLDTLRVYRGQQSADFSFRGDELAPFGTEGGKNYPDYKYSRGDSKANDWYWFGTLNVAIYFEAFGNVGHYLQTRCPNPFRRSR